jgi:hypothetical protein
MSFQDQIAADLAAILNTDEFAVSGVYTPHDAAAKTIDAIMEYGTDGIGEARDGQGRTRRATLHISRDATLGIANPHPDDTWTLSGVIWAIESIVSMDEHAATLGLIRFDAVRKTGQGRTVERS